MLKSYWLAPKIFISAPGILIMVHQVRLMMFLLKMVDYSMSMGGPRLLCQPQSPFGFTGVGLGCDWGSEKRKERLITNITEIFEVTPLRNSAFIGEILLVGF